MITWIFCIFECCELSENHDSFYWEWDFSGVLFLFFIHCVYFCPVIYQLPGHLSAFTLQIDASQGLLNDESNKWCNSLMMMIRILMAVIVIMIIIIILIINITVIILAIVLWTFLLWSRSSLVSLSLWMVIVVVVQCHECRTSSFSA